MGNPTTTALLGLLLGLAAGIGLWLWQRRQNTLRQEAVRAAIREELQNQHDSMLAKSQRKLEQELAHERERLKEEQGQLAKTRQQTQRLEEKLAKREHTMAQREASLDQKLERLDQRDTRLRQRESKMEQRLEDLAAQQAEITQLKADVREKLQTIAGLSREQAREQLLGKLEEELAEEQSRAIARYHKDTEARCKEIGVEIVGRAIQRYAAEHTAESTTAKVKLASEELKGRVIGKDGRNIRAFEQSTGVDLIIDEAPQTIIISCFSGLRREIARRTLEALLEDGRIQPARIEEVLLKTQQEMDREVIRLGEDAAYHCEVSGLHPQIIKLLGKLQYRTSYGQNVLQHTQEVAFLAGAMAADMGLDPKLGRRCGLLHDIGKALDQEQEGSHPELGYEILKRYGESEIVANAALAHHEGHEVISPYTVLAAAADAISAARPGARRENVERYIKRLEQLEDIATSFSGVSKAFAIQAGRELRVIVNGHHVPDNALNQMARKIARRIEDEVTYPGEVKVHIIRETRSTALAR